MIALLLIASTFQETIYISSSGSSAATCGTQASPCNSLGVSFSKSTAPSSVQIVAGTEITESSEIKIESAVTIIGDSTNRPKITFTVMDNSQSSLSYITIKTTDESEVIIKHLTIILKAIMPSVSYLYQLHSLSTPFLECGPVIPGPVTLEGLTVTMSSDSQFLGRSAIEFDNGTLTLKDCTFANITSNPNLIDVPIYESPRFSMSNVVFDNITSQSDSSVFDLRPDESYYFSISNANFTNCKGCKGAALRVSIEDRYSSFHLENLTFKSCAATIGEEAIKASSRRNSMHKAHTNYLDETKTYGGALCVYAYYPPRSFSCTGLTFTDCHADVANNFLGMVDEGDEITEYASLWKAFLPSTEPAENDYVIVALESSTAPVSFKTLFSTSTLLEVSAGRGTDSATCGSVYTPCRTLQQTLTNRKTTAAIMIDPTYKSYTTDHLAASINSSVEISASPSIKFEQKKTCFTVSGIAVSVTITGLNAKVTSDSQYLTTSSLGMANITDVSIYATRSVVLSSSLISATKGILYLDEVEINTVTLNNAPLINVASDVSLNISSSCSFSRITRNTGDGSVLSFTVDSMTVPIRGYYQECTCKNGNGGAVAITITQGTTDIQLFQTPSFLDCSASGSGGAVYITSHRNAAITISNVQSSSPCSAGADGGLLYVETDASTIFRITLESTTGHSAGRDGGLIAAVFNGEGGYLELPRSSSYFYNMCTWTSAKRNGGAISVVGAAGHTEQHLLQLSANFSFIFCTASENGGAISYIQKGKGGLEFSTYSYLSFDDCTASKSGGGMYLDIQGEATISISDYITFTNNTAQTGASIYLNTNQDTLATSTEWRKIVDSSLQSTGSIDNYDPINPILLFSPEVPNTFVIAGSKSTTMDQIGAVSITGKDLTTEQTCPTNACKTLSDYLDASPSTDYRYHRLQYSSTGTVKEEGELLFTSNNFVISGYGTDQKTVLTLSSGTEYYISRFVLFKYLSFKVSTGADTKPTEKSFFIDGYGTLDFFHCSVSAEQQSAELSSELIYLYYGKLVIMSSTFTGMTFANDVLINGGADYTVRAYLYFSTFTNIESKNTDESAGGSVYASDSDSSSLYCVGSTFKSCKSASNGGVIISRGRVNLGYSQWTGKPNDDDDPTVKFEGCTSERSGGAIYLNLDSVTYTQRYFHPYQVTFTTSTAAKLSGNYIYALVDDKYYTEYATYSMWEPFKPTAVKQFIVASTDSSTAATDIFDLVAQSVNVSQTGVDSDTCGTSKSAKPCATIYGAINTYDGTASEITVEAGTNTTESRSSYISRPLTITGSSTNTPTIKCPLNYVYFSIESDVTITSLKFELTYYSYEDELFYVKSSSDFTLDSVTVYSAKAETIHRYTIITCYGPTTIKNCAFANITLSSDSLIYLETDEFVCSGNTFTNIVKKSDDGSVFDQWAGKGRSFSLSHCTFDQCKCLSGNGGAVSITLYDKAQLSMSHLTFTKCEAHATAASLSEYSNALINAAEKDISCGGGMLITLDGEPASVSFSDMSFSGCKATYGSQMAAYTEDEELEDVLYSEELWEGLLSGDTNENEFLLAIVDTEAGTSENPFVITSSKQLSDVAPADSDSGSKSTIIIIVVVVVVVVVIVVVAVIIVCILRSKQKACFAPKNESSADKQANESEMTNETPKEQTKVEVPPEDTKPADQ